MHKCEKLIEEINTFELVLLLECHSVYEIPVASEATERMEPALITYTHTNVRMYVLQQQRACMSLVNAFECSSLGMQPQFPSRPLPLQHISTCAVRI